MSESPKMPGAGLPQAIAFGRDICGDLRAAESREWLVTNGLGGYAFGTIAGLPTRSYHGLLTAALDPPLGRTLLLAKLEETARYGSESFELSTNRWADGTISPQGYRHIDRFHLEGTTPVWTFALADALLEKRVFMQAGANTTYVLYRLVRADAPVQLSVKALADYCAEHQTTSGWTEPMKVTRVKQGLEILPLEGAPRLYVFSDSSAATPTSEWYRNFDLAVERERGLKDRTDYFFAGEFHATIPPGGSLTVVASTDRAPSLDGEFAFAKHQNESHARLDDFCGANEDAMPGSPPAVRQLVLAADQFIAARPVEGAADGKTIIAGYPWFGDWGRDTMIALPGLCLTTGRPLAARNILRTFSRFVDQGMLPNVCPRVGEAPLYNSVDASLWYFEATRQYFEATGDASLVEELYPALSAIMDAYVRGTRYNIRVDPTDGLLFAGEEGVQLTWMDAKVGDRVITPRMGKPVEVSALWLNAAATMARFARVLGRPAGEYDVVAAQTRMGFGRFWNADRQFCFDVIDDPVDDWGNDASLRPNQIFAVSLPESHLTLQQQRAVVDVCSRELLTSFGLRSLARGEPEYAGRYAGGPAERDAAYHQGTVWGWLLGPFALAHLRVYRNPSIAMSFLEPMFRHIQAAGLGTASEIFDGDPPFAPKGCVAQAWTVGETLRAWRIIAANLEKEEKPRAVPAG